MQQTWRCFGPIDKVSLRDARQAGAQAIVTALHHIPPGQVWPSGEIEKRQNETMRHADGTNTGLHWSVVESLPVSEAVKTRAPGFQPHMEAYKQSLQNLAAAGISTICYNFMPVLDWTRTDLAAPLASGGTALRFDLTDFAAFDLFILKRPGAAREFPDALQQQAAQCFNRITPADQDRLARTVAAGLPGEARPLSPAGLLELMAPYRDIDADALRQDHTEFARDIAPLAEDLGLRLCCHPDDPPFPLLGLPRIMSTESDLARFLDDTRSPATGLTFCTGSLGARPENDVPAMAARFAPDIHFAHLRNVTCEGGAAPCSFFEDDHLAGRVDMVAVVAALLAEEARRRDAGRADHTIPMRPDHGQDILTDTTRAAQPGYPAIGRLKGLAELRGVICALENTPAGRIA
jgi:mannonate dehydratase